MRVAGTVRGRGRSAGGERGVPMRVIDAQLRIYGSAEKPPDGHAQALADYGRDGEARAELARAADCEERIACVLEAQGNEQEAAIHRVKLDGLLSHRPSRHHFVSFWAYLLDKTDPVDGH